MFGTQEIEIDSTKIVISSPEKTIVDCLDHPEHCGGVEEVAKALYFSHQELDFAKIVNFAKKIGNNTVLRRLGYVAESLQLEKYDALIADVEVKSGYSVLDPTLPKRGHIKEKWKLVVNSAIEPERWTA